VPFASHCKLCSYAEPKSFSQAKLAYFDFSSFNFITAGLYIEHAGDALSGLDNLIAR
jgi:hypothetical protein